MSAELVAIILQLRKRTSAVKRTKGSATHASNAADELHKRCAAELLRELLGGASGGVAQLRVRTGVQQRANALHVRCSHRHVQRRVVRLHWHWRHETSECFARG